jgi:hypothetical protein
MLAGLFVVTLFVSPPTAQQVIAEQAILLP